MSTPSSIISLYIDIDLPILMPSNLIFNLWLIYRPSFLHCKASSFVVVITMPRGLIDLVKGPPSLIYYFFMASTMGIK